MGTTPRGDPRAHPPSALRSDLGQVSNPLPPSVSLSGGQEGGGTLAAKRSSPGQLRDMRLSVPLSWCLRRLEVASAEDPLRGGCSARSAEQSRAPAWGRSSRSLADPLSGVGFEPRRRGLDIQETSKE